MIRIGHGYDVHRMQEGRRLVLGGVDIPCERGLLGHSDADVVTHALMDAILGAMRGEDDHEFDIPHVVAAEVDVHQAGNHVLGGGVPVEVHALDEGGSAVTGANNGGSDLGHGSPNAENAARKDS